jgi:ABC-2 type transport system ATP-binding protein
MRQRVKLAQALVHDPRFIILDEPTNGFDPKGREEALELIYDVSHRKGMHLLLSSHLLHDVERTCDSVLLLKNGSLIKYGMIRDLKATDGKSVSLMIKGDVNAFAETVQQRGWRFESGQKNQGRLHVPGSAGTQEIFEAARAAGVQIRALQPTEESLEDFFMRTIEE